MIELLSLSDADKTKAADTIEKTRNIMVNIKQEEESFNQKSPIKS